MRFSVWNPAIRGYDYYESPSTPAATNAPKPTHLRERTLGATVEQAAWPLPADVVLVGTGNEAMGMIAVTAATRREALGAGDAAGGSSLVRVGAYLGAGAIIAKLLFGSRGRRRARGAR